MALAAASSLPLIVLSLLSPTIYSLSSLEVERRTFIVRVDPHAKPSIFPTHLHWYHSTLQSLSYPDPPHRTVIHTYEHVFHGFAATLSTPDAKRLSSLPHVLALIPQQVRSLHTTHSPEFLGLRSTDPAGLLKESDFGSDLVVGLIDTGIWPERRSFDDRGLGPVPSKWKGSCLAAGKGLPPTACNRKLIGARFFCDGYEATNGRVNETAEFRSARDSDGHGTHTASIAAGRYVAPAAALGYARGIAAGMAPKARLAVYKVCWGGPAGGCYDSDILRAFDCAVADGVDVISLSVGGAVVPYNLDAIAIAAFSAAAEGGIFVSASAGNGGPGGLTVTNIAPWVSTVGAGSLDRDFPADVILGDGRVVSGVSTYGGPAFAPGWMYPLVYGGGEGSGDGYSASLCLEGSLSPKLAQGKIVLCDRGINSRADKGEVVKKAGGVGMIMANGVFDGEGLVADCHVLPAASVGATNGDVIRKYIAAARASQPATATIVFHGTRLGVKPAPKVASFSARGPNPQTPEILKPDVIAPGLNILAAWPDGVGPAGIPSDKRRTEFNILSGTSMACPHVSGLAALLKAAHPGWSPAAIRSALMTTAYTSDSMGGRMRDESTGNVSTVMDFGAGHVHPEKAMDPGLVYDLSVYDYIDFLCNSNYTVENIKSITRKGANCKGAKEAGHVGNLNYPSLSVGFQQYGGRKRMSTHFIRTVTNVGDPSSVYKVSVQPPRGTKVTVKPERLVFRRAGQKLSFLVRVEAKAVRLSPGDSRVESGAVVWSDGKHIVASPLVVTMQQPLD